MPPAGHSYTIFPHENQHFRFFLTYLGTIYLCSGLVVRVTCITFIILWQNRRNQFIIILRRRLESNGVSIGPHFVLRFAWWFVCTKAVVQRHLNTHRSGTNSVAATENITQHKSPKRAGRFERIERSGNGNKYDDYNWCISILVATHPPRSVAADYWIWWWCHVFSFLRSEMHPFTAAQHRKKADFSFRWDSSISNSFTWTWSFPYDGKKVIVDRLSPLFIVFFFPTFHSIVDSNRIAIRGEKVL